MQRRLERSLSPAITRRPIPAPRGVPLVTREGTEVQIKEAVARKSGATLRVEDIVDDSIVRELEKEGFIDRVYGRQ